jgi:hypothetical protein
MGFANAMMRNTARNNNAKSVGKRRAKVDRRRSHYEHEIQADINTWKPLMDTFDTDKTGTLEVDELKQVRCCYRSQRRLTS